MSGYYNPLSRDEYLHSHATVLAMPRPMQQPPARDEDIQQQQSNGVPEYQPRGQHGGADAWSGDGVHTLSAYLRRAHMAGEMPVRQVPDEGSARLAQQE